MQITLYFQIVSAFQINLNSCELAGEIKAKLESKREKMRLKRNKLGVHKLHE